MKIFKILMVATLMSLPLACKTKQITTSKTKEVQSVAEDLKNDSTANYSIKKKEFQLKESLTSKESLLQQLGLSYNGTSNDDKASVKLSQTDDGLSVDISGAFKMALEQSKEQNKDLTQETIVNLLDSIIEAKLIQNKSFRSEELQQSFHKDKLTETTGMQFGAYASVVLVVCFVVLLGWIGLNLKKK